MYAVSKHFSLAVQITITVKNKNNFTGHTLMFVCFLSLFVAVQVLAKRKEGSGKVKVLLHWIPEDM